MSGSFAEAGGPGVGLFPGTLDVVVWQRTGSAVAIGDLLQLDLALSQAESTQATVPGPSTSGFANAVVPADFDNGIHGVVIDLLTGAGADNTQVKIRVMGICDAYVIAASGNATVGAPGVAATSKNIDAVAAVDEKYIAIFLETKTTPTTRTLAKVWMNGISGFGSDGGT